MKFRPGRYVNDVKILQGVLDHRVLKPYSSAVCILLIDHGPSRRVRGDYDPLRGIEKPENYEMRRRCSPFCRCFAFPTVGVALLV
jgi:hypothetical protein